MLLQKGYKQSPQSQQFEFNLNAIVSNCRKIPLPKSELIHIYDKYVIFTGIHDKDAKLKQKVIQINQKAILRQFQSCMHGMFCDLDKNIKKIQSVANIDILNEIIQKNYPSFMKVKSNQQIKIMAKSRFYQDTPNQFQQFQQKFKNEQQRLDFIFSYILDKLHILLLQYKQQYQIDKTEQIQNSIYQELCKYAEENQYSFMNQVPNNQIVQKSILKENQIKIQNDKEKQKDKSVIMEQLIDMVVDNIEDEKAIKKINQEQQQSKKSSFFTNLTLGKYSLNPLYLIGNALNLIQSTHKKGLTKVIARKLHSVRSKNIRNSQAKYMQNTQQEQNKVLELAQMILKVHAKHNVDKDFGLSPEEFQNVQKYLKKKFKYEKQALDGIFNQKQKSLVIDTILNFLQELKTTNASYYQTVQLQDFLNDFMAIETKNQMKSSSTKKGLNMTLSMKNSIQQLPNIFYIVSMLYRKFQKDYSPSKRRIIIRLCHNLSNRLKKQVQTQDKQKQNKKFSLVHALKLFQSQNVKRNQTCHIITHQKPFRESELPLKHQIPIYFSKVGKKQNFDIDQAQLHLEHQLHRIFTFQHKKIHKEIPKLQLLKLTHSTNKKNITILISGFLSEDTNKFQEWMGMIQPTYDSEVYALKWQSKTMQHMLQFTIDTCKNIALAGAGIGIIGGPYVKAAFILKQIFTRYHQNPFIPSFQIATITGTYLADLLTSLFYDHFINLVGFSLGTQVINSAIERLRRKNKLHMINRVITMGGVADKKQLLKNLEPMENSKQYILPSIAWTNVYCQTDNILKYLLRVGMPSLDPIGLSQVNPQKDAQKQIPQKIQLEDRKLQKIYQLDNINVNQFVDGHLTYRCNMRTIARLVGIKDE